MSRTEGANDKDQEFLDALIALGNDIRLQVERQKDESDDPTVLLAALYIESAALIIQHRAREYRNRIRQLKREAARAASGFTIKTKNIEEG